MMAGSAHSFDRLRSMFDFFFKRARSGSVSSPVATNATPVRATTPTLPERRQQALDQAATLDSDEAAALSFLLSCAVPEARLLAAQHLHSRPMMEQAQKAMREIDRRVAKLMQQRLVELARHDLSRQRMRAAIAQAHMLLGETTVLPNHVAQLEQAWNEAGSAASPEASDFMRLRAELGQRLHGQAELQRRVRDLSAMLQTTLSAPDRENPEQLDALLQSVDLAVGEIERDRGFASLPKQLMPELMATRSRLSAWQSTVQSRTVAVAVREQALAAWEAALARGESGASLPANEVVQSEQAPTSHALRPLWRALPIIQDPLMAAELQARFDALLGRLAPPIPSPKKTRPIPRSGRCADIAITGTAPEFADAGFDLDQARAMQVVALEELRGALEEGALQRAVERDRLLRSLNAGSAIMTPEQQTSLSVARAELTRLQSWAKWGGTVSREELVVAVEGLPQQALGVIELGRKVGSMRERWRALDSSAGPAPRALWLRFDAACDVAYAPVTAHFAALAQLRETNAEKGREILAEIALFVTNTGLDHSLPADTVGVPDWRAIAAFCQRMEQAWQRLGPLERKQQKQLNTAFEQALLPLRHPLRVRQEQAMHYRQQMIAGIAQLAPHGRETLEQLQTLQAQWQQHAKSSPLPRVQEQELWQRFRAACDTVFAQRKQAAASAAAKRNANLAAKSGLCLTLEQLADDPEVTDAARATAIRETRLAWGTIDSVPRAAQEVLQVRFDKALAVLQTQREAARKDAARTHADMFEAALESCLAYERQLLQPGHNGTAGALPSWQPRASLPSLLEQALHGRFDAAQQALAGADAHYGTQLLEHQVPRDTALLCLEVSLGLESPPGFMRERLQLQVAGLQSSFKNGVGVAADTPLLQFTRLCALAASTDTFAQGRMVAIARAVLTRQ